MKPHYRMTIVIETYDTGEESREVYNHIDTGVRAHIVQCLEATAASIVGGELLTRDEEYLDT